MQRLSGWLRATASPDLLRALAAEAARPRIALAPHQTPPPGPWRRWLLLAGRGAGKTLAGASWLLDAVAPGVRMGIVAPTFADVRDVCFEGPSGLLAVARARGLSVAQYNRGMGEAVINGATIKGYSGDEPDRLRGPQHHRLWFDELAAMRRGQDAYDMAMMGLRLGDDPRAVLTTTPRPIPLLRLLLADPDTATTRATTFDNPHLPAAFREAVTTRYLGSRLGRQELEAEILDDAPGALWSRATLDAYRVAEAPATLTRVVVGVDPKSGEAGSGSETGIVVAALGADRRGYVLDDRSLDGSPAQWARQAVAAYTLHRADRIVAEKNQGGAMVEHTLRSVGGDVAVSLVTASRGKATRAEPIAALYEQGRVSHVGMLAALEDQLCTWEPGGESPDRLDALVWALSELFPNTELPFAGLAQASARDTRSGRR